MNTIAKFFMAMGLIAAVGLTISFARAEDDPCRLGKFSEQTVILLRAGANVKVVPQGQVAHLIDKAGPPPDVEGDFELYRYDLSGSAMIAVVQGECINAKMGPMENFKIDTVLGIVEAQAQ